MNTQTETTTKPIEVTPYYEEKYKFTDFEIECFKGHLLFQDEGSIENYYENLMESDLI